MSGASISLGVGSNEGHLNPACKRIILIAVFLVGAIDATVSYDLASGLSSGLPG